MADSVSGGSPNPFQSGSNGKKDSHEPQKEKSQNPFVSGNGGNGKKDAAPSPTKAPPAKTSNPFENAVPKTKEKKDVAPTQTDTKGEKPSSSGKKKSPSVKSAVEETTEKISRFHDEFDLEEDDLIEDDGDMFWVVQRVAWFVAKTVAALGIFFLAFWLIWGGADDDTSPAPQTPPPVQTKVPDTPPLSVPSEEDGLPLSETDFVPSLGMIGDKNHVLAASEWHQWMEEIIAFQDENLITEGITWLRDVKNFLDIPLPRKLAGATKEIRAAQVDKTLESVLVLLGRYNSLRPRLEAEAASFLSKADAFGAEARALKGTFLAAVKNTNSRQALTFFEQKKVVDNAYLENLLSGQTRKIIATEMEFYRKVLRNNRDFLISNRLLIVENARVVDFPKDPFKSVLTPAEWRASQGLGN